MKHTCIRYFTLLFTLLSCTVLKAGNIPSGISGGDSLANGQIICHSLYTIKKGNQLTVYFTLDLTSLSVVSNQQIRLTPLIRDSAHVLPLLPVVINGRRQQIIYERMGKKQTDETPYRIRRKNKTVQSIEYREVIPYESWMNYAHLVINEDLCGCGEDLLEQDTTHLKQLVLEVAPYTVQPHYKFIMPAVEMPKRRAEAGQAFLDFPTGKTQIYPQYRNNPIELGKIHATIDIAKNDSNIRITGIQIHGYASPDGKYESNARLARKRAEALKNYVRRLYHFENRIFSVKHTAEDWDGLSRLIRESGLPDKNEILTIIRKTSDPDRRQKEIAALNKGQSYRYMSEKWFSLLRHCDYRIEYIVRSFTPGEAKKIVKERPQLLSLNEMFGLAQTYQAGNQEFNELFDIAVRLFPGDPVANLNAANAAMLAGNLNTALNYLAKAGNSPEAVHARGIYAMLQNNFEKAEPLLREAQAKNIAEAAFNLLELQKKKENQLLIEKLNHE